MIDEIVVLSDSPKKKKIKRSFFESSAHQIEEIRLENYLKTDSSEPGGLMKFVRVSKSPPSTTKSEPSSCLNQMNLSNFNFILSPLVSITDKLKQVQFADFNPMTDDVDLWLNSFESKLIEFDALDQSLDVVIKFLDHSGLEFYRKIIR